MLAFKIVNTPVPVYALTTASGPRPRPVDNIGISCHTTADGLKAAIEAAQFKVGQFLTYKGNNPASLPEHLTYVAGFQDDHKALTIDHLNQPKIFLVVALNSTKPLEYFYPRYDSHVNFTALTEQQQAEADSNVQLQANLAEAIRLLKESA